MGETPSPNPGPGYGGWGPYPPQPPYPPPPTRRLYRRRDNRVIAGVASGLADYFGTDPVWIRIAFIASIFFGGFGFLAYIAGWIAMPAVDRRRAGGRKTQTKNPYTDQLLKEPWDAGNHDGREEAASEE